MPAFEVDFEVWCAACGNGLCNGSTGGSGRRTPKVDVEPCEKCLAAAREEGRKEAREEAP